jgi:hypothetical protein
MAVQSANIDALGALPTQIINRTDADPNEKKTNKIAVHLSRRVEFALRGSEIDPHAAFRIE